MSGVHCVVGEAPLPTAASGSEHATFMLVGCYELITNLLTNKIVVAGGGERGWVITGVKVLSVITNAMNTETHKSPLPAKNGTRPACGAVTAIALRPEGA
jgi:hypothetical protein